MNMDNMRSGASQRLHVIRARTWSLTLALVIALCFYFLMQTFWKDSVNLIDLVFISALSMIIHCTYFPDGDLFGQQGQTFITNKSAYNKRATTINDNHKVGDLREYCDYDFEIRKERYINDECGAVGITQSEYLELQKKSPKDIKKLVKYEFTDENGDKKLIFFTKKARKRLYKVLFCELPIERNNADDILSAYEHNYIKAIKDGSINYKKRRYCYRFFKSCILATFLAYVGYTFQDGITIDRITRIIIYLVSMFSTAVISFANGETCSKVYKNRYYIDLSNFIDGFLEWLCNTKNVNISISQVQTATTPQKQG